MRKSALLLVAVVLSLAFAPAPLPKPPRPEDDLKRLQGTWELIDEVFEGRPEPRRPGIQLTIVGDRLTFVAGGRPCDSYAMTVGAKAKPKTLDLKGRDGGGSCVALYSLDGNTLAFCWTRGFGPAPRDLSGTGQKAWRMVFQRSKR